MGLNFLNLDQETRRYMVDELEYDLENGTVYFSSRLNPTGKERYVETLRTSLLNGDDVSLAKEIRNGYLNVTEQRRTKNGYTTARVPITAADTLAEGEFNRYYIRALCRRAIKESKYKIVVYRAKDASDPRPASEAKIGESFEPNHLLKDLRENIGVDTGLGLPPGPNSGLSAKLVDTSQETTA
ncbi:hypothetical protein QJ48_07410 [Paenibacillus sp. A3]|uniref:hypothetical protein n=1 Tax=Paenibacillus sp. A3 TaxID=1337054 RepID=UPI0006D5A32F|nr:hypothetical protein [Paenibacillus sp. A3]KPV60112.1 hypothetical protein QJ48_07410 [Paenibacillus sp. A3]